MSDETDTKRTEKRKENETEEVAPTVWRPLGASPVAGIQHGPRAGLAAAQRALADALWTSGLVDVAIRRIEAIIAHGAAREALPAARTVLEYAVGRPSQGIDVALGGAVGHYSMADMLQARQALTQVDVIEGEAREVTDEATPAAEEAA